MAYVVGIANSFAEVLSALRTTCVDAGWTLSGSILSKGGAVIDTGSTATSVWVLGGTGIGAGDTITGAGGRTVYARSPKTGVDVPFPVNYHLHVLSAPDEVYLIINFGVTRYIFVAFGCSPVEGLPGTGCWYTGSTSEDNSCNQIRVAVGSGVGGNYQYNDQCVPAPFWAWGSLYFAPRGGNNSFVHHGLDGGGWSVAVDGGDPLIVANAQHAARPLIERLPNIWNGETVLLPITPGVYRASSKFSLIAEFQHARYLRNDGLSDGQILTLGPDMWKTYPFWLRSTVNRNGNDNNSSGTFGWAVRYDGTPP